MIAIAETDREIEDCFAVMTELRPQIARADFLPTVKRLAAETGFRLVYLRDGEVKAAGGFRIAEWLAGGKYLEIEDLATRDGERSKGYGGALFDWLVDYAREKVMRSAAARLARQKIRRASFLPAQRNDYRSALFFAQT